jgi:cytoskeletal protein RodZ
METLTMKLRAIISSVALVTALSISGAAYAQNMFNGSAIPDDQVQKFKDACAGLQAKDNASLTTDNNSSATSTESTDATTTGSVATQAGEPSQGNSDPAAEQNWDTIIAGLTKDDCAAAGFPVS